jgi:hypothetical protein
MKQQRRQGQEQERWIQRQKSASSLVFQMYVDPKAGQLNQSCGLVVQPSAVDIKSDVLVWFT